MPLRLRVHGHQKAQFVGLCRRLRLDGERCGDKANDERSQESSAIDRPHGEPRSKIRPTHGVDSGGKFRSRKGYRSRRPHACEIDEVEKTSGTKTRPEKKILEGLPRCRGCPRMRDLPQTLGFPQLSYWLICRCSGPFVSFS